VNVVWQWRCRRAVSETGWLEQPGIGVRCLRTYAPMAFLSSPLPSPSGTLWLSPGAWGSLPAPSSFSWTSRSPFGEDRGCHGARV